MRNLLKKIHKFGELLTVRVDGMIHPGVAADDFLAPLHRSFLTSCFLSGTAALFVLPLHLALAGAPHVATILVLAWMLSQWPIAHFLSRTGDLNKAVALSSGLFATFIGAICVMTGGESSFALLWLLVPIVEAAFATSKKVTIGVAALCCGLLAAVSVFSGHVSQVAILSPEARLIATAAALIYTGMLAVRISLDRKRARATLAAAEEQRRLVCSNVSDVLCELDQSGRMTVIGGPVRQMLGFVPKTGEADWLFHRLHVADRPGFLNHLADVKEGGETSRSLVRLRVGSSQPGEKGHATYREIELKLQSVAEDAGSGDGSKVILTFRDAKEGIGLPDAHEDGVEQARSGDIRWNIIEEAGETVRAQMSEIVDLATMVEDRGLSLSEGSLHLTAQRIRSAGNQSAESMSAILDLVPEETVYGSRDLNNVNVAECLKHSSNLIFPLAERLRVGIEINADPDLPDALVERKKFRQSIHLILSELVESIGVGGSVDVCVHREQNGLELALTAVNRQSSTHWSSDGSKRVFDHAAELLAGSGAVLNFRSTLGKGESIVLNVPVRFGKGHGCNSSGKAINAAEQLAQTA